MRGNGLEPDAAQDAEHVVLRARDAELGADALKSGVDVVCGDDQVEHRFLRGVCEIPGLPDAPLESFSHADEL